MNRSDWKQVIAQAVDELPAVQRVIASGLMTDEDDESLADHFGTTTDAVRIERRLAARRLREVLHARVR